MITLEIERGDKEINIDVYDDGDIEVTIYQEHYGWNDGGKAIAGEIILSKDQAVEMLEFLKRHLTTACTTDSLRSQVKRNVMLIVRTAYSDHTPAFSSNTSAMQKTVQSASYSLHILSEAPPGSGIVSAPIL